METVVVTYKQDLNLAARAVNSIIKYGIGSEPNTIHIVINDSPAVFEQAQKQFGKIACVYHYTDISTWIHSRSGWWNQQWLKLKACELITGEWYMPFDSDMWISKHIHDQELFNGSRALCNLRECAIYDNQFDNYIRNACNYWSVDPDEIYEILRETPPNILHKDTVKKMLEEMNPWIFGSTQTPSLEFFVYWIYLHKNNLTQMYQHQPNWFWFGDTFHMDNS